MKNSLFIGKFGYLIVKVNQKVFQVIIVGHEKPEILIRFFERDCSDDLQILDISVEWLKQISFVRVQNVVSLFTSDDLTDRVRPDQKLDDLNCLVGNKFHKVLTKLNYVFLFFLQWNSYSDVLEGLFIVLFVLNKDLQVKLVFPFLLG